MKRIFVLIFCLSSISVTNAQNWSSFRGNNASGVAEGRKTASSEDGDVFVVRAGPTYELLATNVMGQPLMATPAISDGLLFLRTKDFIYAVGER